MVNEVKYGSRVYLTKNGHGKITMIDMQELDEIEKNLALYKFKYKWPWLKNQLRKKEQYLLMS